MPLPQPLLRPLLPLRTRSGRRGVTAFARLSSRADPRTPRGSDSSVYVPGRGWTALEARIAVKYQQPSPQPRLADTADAAHAAPVAAVAVAAEVEAPPPKLVHTELLRFEQAQQQLPVTPAEQSSWPVAPEEPAPREESHATPLEPLRIAPGVRMRSSPRTGASVIVYCLNYISTVYILCSLFIRMCCTELEVFS